MNVSYYLQGKKELVSIYIRIRDTNFDAKTSTKLKINPKIEIAYKKILEGTQILEETPKIF